MKWISRYKLELKERQKIDINQWRNDGYIISSDILDCKVLNGEIFIWVISSDNDVTNTPAIFYIKETGENIEEEFISYLSTIVVEGTEYHIFMENMIYNGKDHLYYSESSEEDIKKFYEKWNEMILASK